jgi:A/G-specific adenine glycosylase
LPARIGAGTLPPMPAPHLASAPAGRRLPLQRLLLAWYRSEARPLPWRRTRDPWRILVSEIMLQQTQAARVEPAYRAFVGRFPTPAALAAAPRADVLTAWRGLGYNRRAVNLHAAATVIVERHGGKVPAGLDELLALPGVGPYTARAVQVFAFGREAAPVDTNVARVLARSVAAAPLRPAAAQRLADEMVPAGSAAEWSNALMDLGARYCGAKQTRCDACPVAAACAWRLDRGARGADPAATAAPTRATRFAGSDRYHRGRLVDALRRGPVSADELVAAADLGEDPSRLAAITDGLLGDGLAEWADGSLRLPA